MTTDQPNIDRISPTRKPVGKPAGYQRWTDLLFLHWPMEPEMLKPFLPAELTVDTFDGQAWIGMVPFYMSGVRPRFFPAVPGISAFCETNIRTYVHLNGEKPGVWFFSLEAAKSLAVRIARWRWHLPYFCSNMSLERNGDHIIYSGSRLWPGEPGAGYQIKAEIGPTWTANDAVDGAATPGTFEHFLAERYILYAQNQSGKLYRGQVHHRPYPLREARLLEFEESLLAAAGLPIQGEPTNVLFSDGVDVKVYSLEAV
ncbi:MAG: hypothetical protein Tsb009_02160 [Planctomycetaceae bacterium]